MIKLDEVVKGVAERYEAHLNRMRKAHALPTRPGPAQQVDKELESNDHVLEDPSQA